MSKKNKRLRQENFSGNAVTTSGDHATEYSVIKGDLIKVLVVNVIFLAGILALYFTNQNSRYLETLFDQFIKF